MGKKDYDCRAINRNFLKEFIDGKFAGFTELVKRHPELCLCFRGNNGDNEAVNIYYNNHLVFKIYEKGRIEISFNLARYFENWEESAKKLQEYQFKQNKTNQEIKPQNGNGIGHLYRSSKKELSKDEIFYLYEKIMVPILKNYFDIKEEKRKDWFYQVQKKQSGETEKIRQQEIYSALKDTGDGYFIYDLEFKQKYGNKEERINDNDSKNNPDMTAIHFENGKPVSFVFIEIKSTESAVNNKKSGVEKHINDMMKYDIKKLPTRINEAYEILKQYCEIGLYDNLKDANGFFKYTENGFEKLKQLEKKEILLIFTDKAKNAWKGKKYSEMREKTDEFKIPNKLQNCIVCKYKY